MPITVGRIHVLGVLAVLFCSSPGVAATRNAANCSSAAVQSAINSAANGDTVAVPAGNCTWSSNLAISDKSITVQGAGAGQTVISGSGFNLTNAASRITGFTFNQTGAYWAITGSIGFRIDHNTIARGNWDFCLFVIGSLDGTRSLKPSEGLIDNNTLTNCRIIAYGEFQDTGGKDRWSEPLVLGDGHSLFVEDNSYSITDPGCTTGGSVACNFVDDNVGGKYVARFNTITNSYFEGHSLQSSGAERGGRAVEIYNNTLTITAFSGFSRPYFIRGGTGMIFHNSQTQNYSENHIDFDNVRTCENRGAPFNQCDGTSFIDGNADSSGWPCRDQIGRSTDAAFWNFGNPAPAQAAAPFYIWKNTSPAGEVTVALNSWDQCSAAEEMRMSQQIRANRDYYQYNSAFNGTAGVGEGPLANRPATCTTGVAYWATDQGEWNRRQAGPDGQLYRCTAPNTWSLYYRPYTYPHPLQSGAAGNTPNAPTNLIVH
jgi:hypothetical protein